MTFEQARDLRSSAQDSKRFKEHAEKWSRGTRPLAGRVGSLQSPWGDPGDVAMGMVHHEKIRPERHLSHIRLPTPNIVKPRGSGFVRHDLPGNYSRAKLNALEELHDQSSVSRSIHDLLPSPHTRRSHSISDNILYSFDRAESPGKPLTLDVFVKTNPKETEKFVEKEYEILDNNGDALKGRKARQNLRRKNRGPTADEPEVIEDDGFELL
ncbi:hypothetical protein GGS23DRAFT_273164 [Durotheca rogersii]|uniref:uncharacterized protein n=1 Tax=Durotheca rogersii TaxID=419775 RepID=UPI00221E602A|nr:uncharacterized protein GGS23DRAFT_273164 [Durotheca rogersii]KAI5866474.1 hypothetical protein GGS23DRAFT_273164 [Durotheca rogersii]